MKKLILISALLFSFNGWAQVSDEIHQRCKDAADYVGCVQVFTGSIPTTKANNSEADLKKALKLLPRRLENTSLRDFSSAIQPFTDALALAETDDAIADSQLVRDSRKIDSALSVAREVWNTSIEVGVEWDMRFQKMPSAKAFKLKRCDYLNLEVQGFNASLEGHAMNYPCSTDKGVDETIRNEGTMIYIIRQAALVIADGKSLDYSPFISVEEHYYKNKMKEEGRKKKKENKAATGQNTFANNCFSAKEIIIHTKSKKRRNNRAAMTGKVAKKLSAAQELIEGEKLKEGLKELNDIMAFKKLTDYERAQVNYFYGYIEYLKEDYEGAISFYLKVLKDKKVPDGLVSNARYAS